MDYLYEDSFKLHDMIDSDIRSLRSECGDYYLNDLIYPHGGSLEPMSLNMDSLDSSLDLENDGRAGWMSGLQLLNGSTDFDSINGLLVNPRTALPISMSDSLNSSSLSLSPSDSSNFMTSDVPVTTSSGSGSITVTVPIQVITSSAMTDVNLTVDVPTPSPSPNGTTSQQLSFSLQDSNVNRDSSVDSPKPKSKNKKSNLNSNENAYPKPAYSYSCLIAMALKNSRTGSLPVNEIYDFMTENFPYFKTAPNGWKNSVRHNLSLNKCFEKIEKPAGNSTQRKGYLWAMNPAKVEKMEEELQKWGSKDPVAIRKSMANPERLELIEKGELRSADSDTEFENMNVSQVEEEEEAFSPKEEPAENEAKEQPGPVAAANESLNDFSFRDTAVDQCMPELDIQKGLWDSLMEDRLPFLTDSPMSPLSPKNSEAMDEDSSHDTTPSSTKSYVHANLIYKHTSRAPPAVSSSPATTDKGNTL